MKGSRATLPVPPSVNNLFLSVQRGSRSSRVKTPAYRAWLQEATFRAKLGLRAVERYPVTVVITVRGGKGFSVQRDIANCEKAVTDALVEAGVLRDDSVRYVCENRQRYIAPTSGSDRASCTVEIIEPEASEAA